MSRLAVAVIEGEELRIRETFGEKGDKRTEAAVNAGAAHSQKQQIRLFRTNQVWDQ